MNDGAAIAPVARPENLQRLPQDQVRGETDALVACALAVPAWRFACRPAPRRISQASNGRILDEPRLRAMEEMYLPD